MDVNVRCVAMNVFVKIFAMPVRMGMDNFRVVVDRCRPIGDPLSNPRKIEHSQENQHKTDGQLHGEANAGRNRQVE